MSEENPQPSATLKLAYPKPLWEEFLWVYATFGIYISFWLVRRVAELKRITGEKFIPWLWFLVPFIAFAQLFAYPKLVNALGDEQKKHNLVCWTAWSGLWYFLIFAASIVVNISNKYEFPGWTLVIMLLVIASLYTALAKQFRDYKLTRTDVAWCYRPQWVKVLSRTILAVLTVTISLIVGYLFVMSIFTSVVEKYDSGSFFEAKDEGIKIKFLGDGWKQIEVGHFSDGSAEYEFQGALEEMNLILFKHDTDANINQIMDYRLNALTSSPSNAKCRQWRSFEKGSSRIVARAECRSQIVNVYGLDTVVIIETEDAVIELIGSLNAIKRSFLTYESDFLSTALSMEGL